MTKKNYDLLFKLLLIGDSAVGKSSLVVRFTDGTFNNNFIATIGIDFKIKTVELDGKIVKLQIWDTAGQERFETITTSYYRGAMGIILLYDITNSKSFDNVTKWLHLISEHANEDVEKILVGNKCDMIDKRAVLAEDAQRLASENRIAFFEVSAKEDIHVTKAFIDLARTILKKMHRKQAPLQADARVIQVAIGDAPSRRQYPHCCFAKHAKQKY